jgi:hypothetical protein
VALLACRQRYAVAAGRAKVFGQKAADPVPRFIADLWARLAPDCRLLSQADSPPHTNRAKTGYGTGSNLNERPLAFPRLHLPEQLTNRETS